MLVVWTGKPQAGHDVHVVGYGFAPLLASAEDAANGTRLPLSPDAAALLDPSSFLECGMIHLGPYREWNRSDWPFPQFYAFVDDNEYRNYYVDRTTLWPRGEGRRITKGDTVGRINGDLLNAEHLSVMLYASFGSAT
jgi:hypothetical protein